MVQHQPQAEPAPRRRVRGAALTALAGLLVVGVYGTSVLSGMQPSLPFDLAVSAGTMERDATLAAPSDGARRLVVLVHGLWRSSASLGRMQRALEAHGYEVLAFDYPSTQARIEEHAGRLGVAVVRAVAQGPAPVELHLVGHSMGGLVIQQWLRTRTQEDPLPTRCVFVATPHRGALLAELRCRWWPFRLALGEQAALQLRPGDPFHQQPLPTGPAMGAIAGSRAWLFMGSEDLPGADDGTVRVVEATLPEPHPTVLVAHGHTAIANATATIRQVLHFLKNACFAD